MSRRNEDFDEFCDPENPREIKYQDVMEAAGRIKPHVIYTPCLASHFQKDFVTHLYYKLEFQQKSGSFKERGSLNALLLLPPDKKKIGVVMASIGNEAVGLCYYASKMSVPVIIVMPQSVPIAKLQKCHNYGAKVLVQGNNLTEAQRYARAIAKDKGLTYINGRDHPHVLAGYGTIAVEILEQVPSVDAVIVPVGSGGLIAAVASVIKHVKPGCLVYGVQTEAMPVMFKSLESSDPVAVPVQATLADAIAVSNVGVNAFNNVRPLLDKMLLVNEEWIARAMLHLIEKERFVIEAAGSCPLAAIIGNLVPELKLKNVVCILSGGNVDNLLLTRCLDRGLAAEGRLVKFKVGIKNTHTANTQLLKLLSKGGYNLVRQFRDNSWVEDDTYTIEVKLVCETRNLQHALELKRIIEKAYPCTSVFDTEPLNDKRTCPCYLRKPS
ncbi:L-threonine ammonia-lyase-like [Aphomia sociella]